MTPEIWTILGVGVALAGLIFSGLRGLRADLNERMDRLDGRIDRLEARMDKFEGELGELRKDQARLDNRMARLEGLLEGLREAIAHNRAA